MQHQHKNIQRVKNVNSLQALKLRSKIHISIHCS